MKRIHFDDFLKQRRKKLIRGLLFFATFIFILFLLNSYINKDNPFIAKLSIDSIIMNNPELIKQLELLKNNKNLRAVLVDVNSPGGTVVGSKEIYDNLKKISEKIPVAISMKEVAASGGYMVALAGNKIFCYEGTITGSVGVIMQSVNIEKLLESLGIEPVIFKSGELKAKPNPIEKLSSSDKDIIQKIIKSIHESFLTMVKNNRKISEENLKIISDGRIFTGIEAKKINLVDEIGSEKDALDWLKAETKLEKDIDVIKIEGETNFSNVLDILSLKGIFKKKLSISNGLFAIWAPYYE
ncbi:MAG: signal peptide peptidase SppA [Rickettsiales bacterium]|nr:signal peptide peptidase SppA [Rickettsiales bacterium]